MEDERINLNEWISSKISQKILNPLVRVIGLNFYASRQRYQELLDKK